MRYIYKPACCYRNTSNCTCNLSVWLEAVVTVEGWSQLLDVEVFYYSSVYCTVLLQSLKREYFVAIFTTNSEMLVCFNCLYLCIQFSLLAMSCESDVELIACLSDVQFITSTAFCCVQDVSRHAVKSFVGPQGFFAFELERFALM